jgi:MFS family permease
MPYCVSSLFVVILGYIVDKIKKRSNVVIASCSFITITYLIMMIIETEPTLNSNEIVRWIPSFLLGLCIAIFCAILVPTVPMLVNPKLLGTGFGIMEMLQNFALGVFPLLAGALRESKGENKLEGFHFQTLFFFLISCLCTGISIILKSVDLTTGNRLDVKDFRKKYLEHFLHEKP